MLLAAAVTLALATHSFAYDDLGVPPPDPAGTVQVPLTNATVQKELDQRLADRFQSVVGSSPRLTEQQAKDASWGFVSDHFAEIDREKKGYVTVEDIEAFKDARSPTPTPKRAPRAAIVK
jgi:hypothetical protein